MNSQLSRKGILFVISGPSGIGKTTLCNSLTQSGDIVYSVSSTTRRPRVGEIDGKDYHFISQRDFLSAVKAGKFLEHAKIHRHYYGTPADPVTTNLRNGCDVLVDIDTQGAHSIRHCPDSFVRDSLADVFIMPRNLEELQHRLLRRRTETPQQIESRLKTAAREMRLWSDYRYTIISRSMEADLEKFRHIINAERYLSHRLNPEVIVDLK